MLSNTMAAVCFLAALYQPVAGDIIPIVPGLGQLFVTYDDMGRGYSKSNNNGVLQGVSIFKPIREHARYEHNPISESEFKQIQSDDDVRDMFKMSGSLGIKFATGTIQMSMDASVSFEQDLRNRQFNANYYYYQYNQMGMWYLR